MHRLARQARPALRAVRAARFAHTEASQPAPKRGSNLLTYTLAGLTVGGVLALGNFKFDPEREARHAAAAHASGSDSAIVDALHDAAAHADEDDHIIVEREDDEDGAPRVAPYNPETGEFNWDCPCLGGLPQSVCGEQFKESFRCFVQSEAEPKGMDCIDAFNAMQTCFREHPEIYSREISIYDEIDEEEDAAKEQAAEGDPALAQSVVSPKSTSDEARTPILAAASEGSGVTNSSPSNESRKP
ncbi:hypothetical protein EXIGLDRAFT_667713 [Exidia glandulosa HHB12029]|uniref:Mitochondrial intermembrane space import and assembly protein 40 n=1 Tax=Exidia glandulosa HHB12029 TaxID=1314781 RepID=A0A166BED6_EXIGL|nr:hypothetical protein EXIGLDRAFT_667713 [Exidia glandulosa HHB12029]